MSDYQIFFGVLVAALCIGVIALAAHVGGSVRDDDDPWGGP